MSYAELHCKTNFSFLIGASHADELVQRADQLGYAALAVTDRNSLAGIVRAHVAAKAQGLKLIVGAEILPQDAWPLVLWAPDRAAYGRLSRLITVGRRQAPKGECILTRHDILHASEGLLAGIVPPSHHLLDDARGLDDCRTYRDAFGDRLYLLAELHHGPADHARRQQLSPACAASRGPSGGRWRRALSRTGTFASARCDDRHPPRHHGGPDWSLAFCQRPATRAQFGGAAQGLRRTSRNA